MPLKMESPAALAADRALEMFRLATVNSPENKPAPHNIQEIRATWIARRTGISPDIAAVVAGLAFGNGGTA